jgi:DNA-binding CsgD family transcriptional regulator
VLVGRTDALERIAWVVSGARAGRGAALLLRGDPGSGKTALLAAAAERAEGMTILRCTGTQNEWELPFAALHALVRPLRHLVAELVPAQRDALDLALGVTTGGKPAPLLVGAATLSLLDIAADASPVLIVVDDLHWIDVESRDAIGFAARRLEDDAVGVLIAVRPEGADLAGIDHYDLPALPDEDGAALLADLGVTRSVALRLLEGAGGNPLALVELARSLDPEQRRGAAPLPDPMPSTSPAAAYSALIASLPVVTRLAGATAAAAGAVAPALLADALARVGSSHDDLAVLESSGLLRVTRTGVTWRHPLAVVAAVDSVDAPDRRRIHVAVADALEAAGQDPASVVWHRVKAATGPDEDLAAALDTVAATAAARGAHQAAAQAWETAARLGREPARRLAYAALESWAADDSESATRLVDEALPGLVDADLRWSLCHTAGQIAHAAVSPLAAWDWFMRAVDEAHAVGATDREVKALASAFNPGLHLDDAERLSWLADRIQAAASPDDPVQLARSHAVQGFVLLNADVTEAGRRHLETALSAIEARDLLAVDSDLLPMTVQAVMWSGRPRRLRPAIDAAVARLRAAGDTRVLAATVRGLAWCDFSCAEWDAAAVTSTDALDLARITGRIADITDALVQVATLEAARGHTADALAHTAEAHRLAVTVDSPWRIADALWCTVFALITAGDLEGLGAPTAELANLLREGRVAAAQPEYFDAPLALALTGRRDAASDLLAVLLSRAGDDARPESRAGALLARCAIGPDSAELAGEAAELAEELDGVEYVFPRARVRLAGGAMSRRLGQRVEARAQLRGAETDFAALGAQPWLVKAQEELRASGATLRTRAEPADALTASEARVARAAADGLSNKEIAASLFLSGKTVEFHLGRIYRKLGVRSRSELVRVLLTADPEAAAPTARASAEG